MPFLTRELPPGGRHIAPPPAVAAAPANARLRQLLPVGLLVAASSAGVALSPVIEGAATADGSHHDGAGHGTTQAAYRPAAVPATTQSAVPGTGLSQAAYVLPHGKHGKHRGAHRDELASPATVGGRHRADQPTGTSTASTSTAKSTSSTATSSAKSTSTPKATAKTSSPTTTSSSSTSSTGAASSTSTSPSSKSSTASDPVTALTGTVTGAVGGVLGTVNTLLGGS